MSGFGDELRSEQAVVDALYARLDVLRSTARGRLGDVRRAGPSGSPQNRSERDAFATLYGDRLAQLESVEERLVFGRLDATDGSSRYVGRIGLTDDAHASILTDWRAPAAQAFYRATSARPDGVVRRRHLVTRRRTVTGIEDELLDLAGADAPDASTLSGEGALLASLAQGRTGRMGDIVATIQAEQDAIIRSSLTGALVVQGGPGTGKTAVALHRAAYLLYAHRRVLERSGVLLVGPSTSFLRYIDQVLPSLGETGVVATTIADLVPGIRARGVDSPEAARVKGLALMQRVVRRAVRTRERVPARDVPIRLDGRALTIRRHDVREAIARARRTNKAHNLARATFVREMLGRLADQYGTHLGERLVDQDRADVVEDLRVHRDVQVALNLAWLPMSPQWLLEDLLAKPHRIAELAPELSARERAAIVRPKGSPWTPADVPLLDEAAELLGEDDQVARAQARAETAERAEALEHARQVLASTGAGGGMVDAEQLAERFATTGPRLTTAERAQADRAWTYGHVVVDEAQELSAMAWRALARRCPTRSFTIVGDVAQTSSPAGTRSWARALEPVFRDSWRIDELTVNYRTPSLVADAAQRFAHASGLPVSPLVSARDVDDALAVVPATQGTLVDSAVDQALTLASTFVGSDGAGRVALVAVPSRVAGLRDALAAATPGRLGADLAATLAAQPQDDAQLVVLTPQEVKGLEYDAVVLVEPAAIAHGDGGASDLYVAATRPTRRLVVVHAEEIPAGLVA
ncbi:DNA helicase IV [Sediminihabitans luteus]|uniref:DNA helicase IV n=1 Tax=Sediminihabitans luteus TaxID=1138585 RepID=A0A2M9CCF8_9CELL|nr:AAA family ATPase [Sediminihabitans luteus]PJJ69062.1 DNA helicase IV [Sediminihabitans luteus]GII99448.1 DNA helicase [Sediminihabitans luteus]